MSMYLGLILEKTHFVPNEAINGQLSWQLDVPPETFRIALIWETDGRGTQDSKEEVRVDLTTNELLGQKPFKFTLPASPYSFSGKLIHLHWSIEVKNKKNKQRAKVPIMVGPDEKEVKL